MYDKLLTEEVMTLAIELGADLVGIGPVERWKNAPKMLRPRAYLPSAKSVIVAAIHHPDAVIEFGGRPTPHDQGPYWIQIAMNRKLDFISFNIAKFLEERGYKALPFPASNIWRYRPYKSIDTSYTTFSHRHAAVAAGLGELGWNGLLLTPEYGPRQRVVSIITDAPLEPTPMYEGPPLCDRCFRCVEACPMDVFRKDIKGYNIVKIENKTYVYPKINKWRCAWCEHWGLSIDLPVPEEVSEEKIWDALTTYGIRGGTMGYCLRFCMVPHLRVQDPNTEVYRRKKKFVDVMPEFIDRAVSSKIRAIAARWNVNIIGFLSAERLRKYVRFENYLPNTKSIILLGIEYPSIRNPEEAPAQIKESLHYISEGALYLLEFAVLDICRYLDSLGYAAMPTWQEISLINDYAIKLLGIPRYENFSPTFSIKRHFISILTDASLKPDLEWRQSSTIERKTLTNAKILTNNLRKYAYRLGADLFGIAPIERLNKIPGVMKLLDYLPMIRSIVVIGLHYPDTSVERAGEPPAESTESYAFVQYQAFRQLCYIAIYLANYLHELGYLALPLIDVGGEASKVASPRGALPDIWANRYAAVAAGLGELGWNGLLLTPEYGPRQRVVSIITDAPLEPTPMYEGPPLCDRCFRCVEACPVGAISPSEVTRIEIGGRIYEFGLRDCTRCDWAKRFALVGEEGPKYMGVSHDFKPPEKVTLNDIKKALKKLDPTIKYHPNTRITENLDDVIISAQNVTIVERCLKACMQSSNAYKIL